MHYPTERIYEICCNGNVREDEAYRSRAVQELLPTEQERKDHGESLVHMLTHLPPPAKQRKILNRLQKIANEHGCELNGLSWWDISTRERALCGVLMREGQRIRITFMWRNANGNSEHRTFGERSVQWVPDAESANGQRLLIEANRYKVMRNLFEAWVQQPR
ncbi:hypothetical protein GF380_03435 [Candidatus Uhrbacteria bacterium]|nr:hypothetical protein [Candidatus Uhrbacteria bacterium]MBD3284185.1 hypothetical protein [Candidatus Uhrbacteria bacterium]